MDTIFKFAEFVLFVVIGIFLISAIVMTFKIIFTSGITLLYCAKTITVWGAIFVAYRLTI